MNQHNLNLKALVPSETKNEREHLCKSCSPITTQDLVNMELRIETILFLAIEEIGNKIMSAISDFLSKQTAFDARQSTAIDALVASIAGVSSDVDTLNAKITELQNSSGGVTPEDQASINALQEQGEALSTKLEAVSTALAALDAQTPPAVPPTA